MRVRLLVAVVAMMLLPVGLAVAGGQKPKSVHSSVKITGTYDNPSKHEAGVTGKVSTQKKCRVKRKVVVLLKDGGRKKKVGKATTFVTGRWEAKTTKYNGHASSGVEPGSYVAKVRTRKLKNGTKCKFAKSPSKQLPRR